MSIINLKGPHLGFSGEYRAVLRNEDGSLAHDSGWEPNLITTRGEFLYSHHVAFQFWFNDCHIGDGATAPDITDTELTSWLAQSTSVVNTDPAGNSAGGVGPNYERWVTKTYRFGAGVGDGTIREMGLGISTSTASYLFSHHLLTAPIVKGPGQTLDVSYRFTIWPSLIETEALSVLIGGVNYDCLTSFYDLTNIAASSFSEYNVATVGSSYTYDGIKAGPEDTEPAGNQSSQDGVETVNTNGTGVFNVQVFYALGSGNTATNEVRTATIRMNNAFHIQTQFTAIDGPNIGGGIPKDAEKEMTLNYQMTWGERP
jgi:hypothetical protein